MTSDIAVMGERQLEDVRAVAARLGISVRHVYRMADEGRMPPPVKLGGCVRWRVQDVDDWVATGCKPIRTAAKRAKR